jgi:IclR family pca regulon transcriptional regulator
LATPIRVDDRVIDWPGEYVQSLDRGLAVIRSFTGTNGRLTIADVSRVTGLTRASVRRSLHTLLALGYAGYSEGRFFLRPRVLELGYAYLSSASIPVVARAHLVNLSERLDASCAMAVLDGHDILFVAVAQAARLTNVSVGSRLPAHVTSMGHVLLAGLPDDDLEARLQEQKVLPSNDLALSSPDRLWELIGNVRRYGFALVADDLTPSLRSVAAPVRDAMGLVVAAISASDDSSRASLDALRTTYRKELVLTARNITYDLAARS